MAAGRLNISRSAPDGLRTGLLAFLNPRLRLDILCQWRDLSTNTIQGGCQESRAERLVQHGRLRRNDLSRATGHKDVRHGNTPKNRIHRRYATAVLQVGVDNHEFGCMPLGRVDGLRLCPGGVTDVVSQLSEDFYHKGADVGIILDQQDAKPPHGPSSLPQPPSSTRALIFSFSRLCGRPIGRGFARDGCFHALPRQ